MSGWADHYRKVPRSHASPSEVDRRLGFPRLRAVREADVCLVSWEFPAGLPENLSPDWTWSVERSVSPGGPFTTVAEALPNTATQWRDDELGQGRENTRRLYYRVRILDLGDETTYGYRPEYDTSVPGDDSHGFTWTGNNLRTAYTPPVVRESRRRFTMMVRKRTRVFAALYRADWKSGTCPQCVDPVTGTHAAITDCPSCLGTGFSGGFCTPLRAEFGRHGTSASVAQHVSQGPLDLVEAETFIWPHWPIPEQNDIVRMSDGRFYELTAVKSEVAYQVPIVHVTSATQLPRTHILAKVPMPETLLNAALGPRRQHGRAKTIESYYDSLTDGGMARAGGELPGREDDDRDR